MNATPTMLVAVRKMPPVGERTLDTDYDVCDCGARVVWDGDTALDYPDADVVHDCADTAGVGGPDFDERELYARIGDEETDEDDECRVLHLAGETPHWPEDRDR